MCIRDRYYGISPYVYCLNNPTNSFDPDGKAVWFIPLIKGVAVAVKVVVVGIDNPLKRIAEKMVGVLEVNSLHPVSYTHLDVYKRQLYLHELRSTRSALSLST